jgi:hypothetical protein
MPGTSSHFVAAWAAEAQSPVASKPSQANLQNRTLMNQPPVIR